MILCGTKLLFSNDGYWVPEISGKVGRVISLSEDERFAVVHVLGTVGPQPGGFWKIDVEYDVSLKHLCVEGNEPPWGVSSKKVEELPVKAKGISSQSKTKETNGDLTADRDMWRDKAVALQVRVAFLEQELARLKPKKKFNL